MLVENDFAIDGDDERIGPGHPAEPAAVVVVRSRRLRPVSILLPPALIVVAAVAVIQYRARTPDWRGLFPERDSPTSGASLTSIASRPR